MVSHDPAALDKYEADKFRIVYPDGTVVTKAQELAAVKKPHKPRDPEFKISTETSPSACTEIRPSPLVILFKPECTAKGRRRGSVSGWSSGTQMCTSNAMADGKSLPRD
jgi:hypothetical protein